MRPRNSWAFWVRAALPVAALLLAAAGPAFSYLYQQDVGVPRSVGALRCTDIYLPGTIKIEWDYSGLGGVANPTYEIRRTVGGSSTVLGQTTNKYYVDSFTWSWDTPYTYEVRVVTDYQATMNLPAPPMGANPADIYMRQVANGTPWTGITVTPRYVTAAANQAVDSRLDLRYGGIVYKDFQFGSRVYRGGLFAGYAADQSKVGRSFLGFTLPSLSTGTCFWTGSLDVYHTRNAATGTATVGVHEVSDSWTENAVVWTTAPTLTPGSPLASLGIAWNSGSPVSSWQHFTLEEPIGLNMVGDGSVTFGLAATNEATNAWAYFAKNQWDSNYGPRIVYATGAPAAPLELRASPNPVTGGSTSTGTVYLNGTQSGSTTVTLSSSNPTVASVPASVSVTGGLITQTFTITTASVMSATNVTITASANGYSEPMTLTVNP